MNLEEKIDEWISKNKKIIIIGTEDHTKLLFENFNKLSKVKLVGFVKFFNKFDFNYVDKVNLKRLNFEEINNFNFDEALISSYEYNFEIIQFLKKYNIKKYSIYDNTSRSFYEIFNKKLLYKYESRKL